MNLWWTCSCLSHSTSLTLFIDHARKSSRMIVSLYLRSQNSYFSKQRQCNEIKNYWALYFFEVLPSHLGYKCAKQLHLSFFEGSETNWETHPEISWWTSYGKSHGLKRDCLGLKSKKSFQWPPPPTPFPIWTGGSILERLVSKERGL